MPSFNELCSNTLPEGVYKVQVTDIKIKTANGTPTNNLIVNYTVVEGEYSKRTLVDTIYEKAFTFRLKPFLEACGVDLNREFDNNKELFNYGISNAKGKIIMIEVGTRMYNGNKYNDIKSFSALPGSTTSASEVSELVKALDIDKANFKTENKEEEVKLSEDVVEEPKLDFSFDDEDLF